MTTPADLSTKLAAALEGRAEDEWVEVVVELAAAPEPPSEPSEAVSRGAKIAALKRAFEEASTPVSREIEEAGGEVLGSAWLNQTLKARLPCGAVEALAGLAQVRRLDAPRRLTPED